MKKRLVAVGMATVMSISLAACGNMEMNDNQNAEGGELTDRSENGSPEEKTGADNDLYGYEEPVTIKVGFGLTNQDFYGGETYDNNSWIDLYKEHNIVLDILYNVDSSQADTKFATAIMSGDYPDVICTGPSDYVNYANDGVTADITDLLEEYGSEELKEYLYSDGGVAMEALKQDGKLYGLPKMGSAYDKVPLMFIRGDWLENLGLEVPETMDELKEVAYAFTYSDPDQNGKDDTYGLAIAGVSVVTTWLGDASAIFSGFGAHIGTDAMALTEGEDGKITWGGMNTEGMKEAITFLKGLYDDGSLAKDFVTMTTEKVGEEANAGRCGIWFGPMSGGMDAGFKSMKSDAKSHVICTPVPDGLGQGGSKSFLPSAYDSVYCVSSQCENPEVLIKLMNLSVKYLCHSQNEEEYYRYYGDSENYTGWKLCLTPTLEPLKNYQCYQKMGDALKNRDDSKLNPYEKDIYNSLVIYLDALEDGTFDAQNDAFMSPVGRYTVYGDPEGSYAALSKMIQEDRFVESAYNAPLTDEQAEVTGTLQKMTIETIVKIVTGAEPIEYYDTFLEQWKVSGGQDYINTAQETVDANQ